MTDEDRDLVVMRHNFVLEDPKTKKRWNHYSTLIASGSSKKQGGYTIMAKTVGMTAAIATRYVIWNPVDYYNLGLFLRGAFHREVFLLR